MQAQLTLQPSCSRSCLSYCPASEQVIEYFSCPVHVDPGNLTVGGADTDNGFLGPAGVPLGSLEEWDYEPENGNPLTAYYFYFHHRYSMLLAS